MERNWLITSSACRLKLVSDESPPANERIARHASGVTLFQEVRMTALNPPAAPAGTANAECLLCKAPLEYLVRDTLMECAVCRRQEMSKTRCVNGHYVCNACHSKGAEVILSLCLEQQSKNPVVVLEKLMSAPFCHMHGPEHHVLVGAALLTAYANSGGATHLREALLEMLNRGGQVPGGVCGFWGACGAGISAGMLVSVVTGATPLAGAAFGLANQMTSRALAAIGEIGGPRCCKRDSYLSIREAVAFVREKLGVRMELDETVCGHSAHNNQCIGRRCPFFKGRHPAQ